MSRDKDRSQKRKAKLEARRKHAIAKATRTLARRQDSPEMLLLGSGPHDTYLQSPQGAMVAPAGSDRWPVVRAYAPVPDVWAATGYGTAAIVRQSPDGQIVEAAFKLTAREGLDAIMGKPDVTSMDDLLLELPSVRDNMPPCERSTPERAAEFIWGAFALARHQGAAFPGVEGYLRVVPRVPGDARTWRDRFVGTGGLTPRELVELVMSLPAEAFTDTKEPMVLTTASFHVEAPVAMGEILAAKDPEFHLSSRARGELLFDWTREYPRGHWSPLALLGGRQVLGNVTVREDELVAEAKSLSMTARLMAILKQLSGTSLRLAAVQWMSPHDGKTREMTLP